MRILHTSDWHLGISLSHISLLEEQKYFVTELIHIIEEEKIDAVVIAGDIFDSSVSNSDAIALYNDVLTAICGTRNIPVLMIAGNHDGAARLAACRDLLRSSGLYIAGKVGKAGKGIQPVILGDAVFYSIPYFSVDEVRILYPETEIKTYEDAMMVLCDDIRRNMDDTKRNIVIAHAFVSGAALSESDRSAMIGTVLMVSKDVFKGFDYVALGHLHRAQNVGDNVRYSGSPLKYSMSEADNKKSVTIIDTADMSRDEVELTQLHDVRVIRGTYDDILESAVYSEDYIKIEITDRFVSIEALGTFRTFYPNLLAVSGKSVIPEEERITLTVDEIERLSPEEMLNKFFMETLQYAPEKEQMQLFREALSAIEKEEIS